MGKRSNNKSDEDLDSYLDKKESYTRDDILMKPNGRRTRPIDPGLLMERDSSRKAPIDPGIIKKFGPKKELSDYLEEPKGYKKGGVTRADGCVTKGHTRGKMV